MQSKIAAVHSVPTPSLLEHSGFLSLCFQSLFQDVRYDLPYLLSLALLHPGSNLRENTEHQTFFIVLWDTMYGSAKPYFLAQLSMEITSCIWSFSQQQVRSHSCRLLQFQLNPAGSSKFALTNLSLKSSMRLVLHRASPVLECELFRISRRYCVSGLSSWDPVLFPLPTIRPARSHDIEYHFLSSSPEMVGSFFM
jgi:hypothetical protein